MAAVPSKTATLTAKLAERFQELATAWHRDTDYLSSMAESDRHPAYLEIIGLGPAVVPLLLRDLEANHTHWFGALAALTGAQPIPASAAGNVPRMVEAWLTWAREQGYRW